MLGKTIRPLATQRCRNYGSSALSNTLQQSPHPRTCKTPKMHIFFIHGNTNIYICLFALTYIFEHPHTITPTL